MSDSAAAGSEREALRNIAKRAASSIWELQVIGKESKLDLSPSIEKMADIIESAINFAQAARAAAPPNDQTLLDVFAEIMEMAPVRHTLGLNHSYESRCTCLRCRADQAIEGAAAPAPPSQEKRLFCTNCCHFLKATDNFKDDLYLCQMCGSVLKLAVCGVDLTDPPVADSGAGAREER